jgi:hypothetical protein
MLMHYLTESSLEHLTGSSVNYGNLLSGIHLTCGNKRKIKRKRVAA